MGRYFFLNDTQLPADTRQSVAYWVIRARHGDKYSDYVTPEISEDSIRDTLTTVAQMEPHEAAGMIETLLFYGYLSISHQEQVASYTKEFDLCPGDRIRVTMPARAPFPAGWAEGTVIEAHWYSDTGWYIELEKENVSSGWQTGYGYWKQREDGGTVEKM